jgi:hypothetical protein
MIPEVALWRGEAEVVAALQLSSFFRSASMRVLFRLPAVLIGMSLSASSAVAQPIVAPFVINDGYPAGCEQAVLLLRSGARQLMSAPSGEAEDHFRNTGDDTRDVCGASFSMIAHPSAEAQAKGDLEDWRATCLVGTLFLRYVAMHIRDNPDDPMTDGASLEMISELDDGLDRCAAAVGFVRRSRLGQLLR